MRLLCITAVAVAAALVAPIGCGSDDIVFYEVVRAREEECSIRSTGEFCVEPEQFTPPDVSVWTVEFTPAGSRLFVDEEVWVLEPVEEGTDPRTSQHKSKRTSSRTSGNGPCTSTREESLSFRADGDVFRGTLDIQTVLTGPEACGSTPVGDRVSDSLKGSSTTSDGLTLVGP